MLIQINVWGSKKLSAYLMARYEQNLWLDSLRTEQEKDLSTNQQPSFQFVNPARGCYGNLMPKLLYFYDFTNSDLSNCHPIKMDSLRESIIETLGPYYDPEIGFDTRIKDRDNMQVYPYLSQESKDYFTTHNINCRYAGEDYLRLLKSQLHALDPNECYMFIIYAYCENFDQGYQYVHVNTPDALITTPMQEPGTFSSSWLAETDVGYYLSESFEQIADIEELNGLKYIPRSLISKWLQNGKIDGQQIIDEQVEIQYFRKWHNHFEDKAWSHLVSDMFFTIKGFDTCTLYDDNPHLVPFDW